MLYLSSLGAARLAWGLHDFLYGNGDMFAVIINPVFM